VGGPLPFSEVRTTSSSAPTALCTHERVHLCEGWCWTTRSNAPSHNGKFDYRTGEALRAPVCVNLKTYPVKVGNGRIAIEI